MPSLLFTAKHVLIPAHTPLPRACAAQRRRCMNPFETQATDKYMDHPTAVTLGELTSRFWEAVEQRGTPVPTGIRCLDAALGGGLVPGRLLALLGGPGSGKTALANQIAEAVASSARPVVYLTLEETGMTLLAKTMSRVGDLDYG